jgi:hypothetical protein
MATVEDRFWANVDKSGDCWEWQASVNLDGYGRFCLKGKRIRAHRLSWVLANGEIPEGMCVLHKCDNPPCVSPDHLFLGTRADNVRDMVQKGRCRSGTCNPKKTHCSHGHEYSEDSTYVSSKGARVCKKCMISKVSAYNKKNRARINKVDRERYHRNKNGQTSS